MALFLSLLMKKNIEKTWGVGGDEGPKLYVADDGGFCSCYCYWSSKLCGI